MTIHGTSNTQRERDPLLQTLHHWNTRLCQNALIENNKDFILRTVTLTAIELSLYDHEVISTPFWKAYYFE